MTRPIFLFLVKPSDCLVPSVSSGLSCPCSSGEGDSSDLLNSRMRSWRVRVLALAVFPPTPVAVSPTPSISSTRVRLAAGKGRAGPAAICFLPTAKIRSRSLPTAPAGFVPFSDGLFLFFEKLKGGAAVATFGSPVGGLAKTEDRRDDFGAVATPTTCCWCLWGPNPG